MSPTVTVIVLMYNDLPHAHRAVKSVLSQTYKDLKIKIMDNGSTDNTWKELQQYKADPRVVLIRNAENQLSEFAAYEALRTDTEYLSFLFADDVYKPERIELGIKTFQERPDLDVVFFNPEAVDEFGHVINGKRRTVFEGDISLMTQYDHLRHCFFHGPSVHPCGMLIKAKTYMKLGGFRPYFHRMGDLIFFARLLSNAKAAFLPQKMQQITVWSNNRNDSAKNDGDPPALLYERTMLLDEYLSPRMMEQYIDIFERGDHRVVLKTEADRLWYIGHQALRAHASDVRQFGFHCLYKALAVADEQFFQDAKLATGLTIPQYLSKLADGDKKEEKNINVSQAAIDNLYERLRLIERWTLRGQIKWLAHHIPLAMPTYRFLRSKCC